jgi:queuine tRNA-ribosyltransferase
MTTPFFETTSQSSTHRARTGIMHTDHGDVETPIFMPVGTQATVKSLDSFDLEDIEAQIILANTYHLHLRPNEDLIDDFGGLHEFMQWDKPILTDSGGFQVLSLGKMFEKKELEKKNATGEAQGSLVKIDDDGVDFRSHIDGSLHRFTPEEAIKIQHKLGADIIMAFDECTPDGIDEAYTKKAMKRTHEWAVRCLDEHKKDDHHHGYKQFLFGIIQGSNHEALRKESAKVISDMDFDGVAIGGESVGFNMEATKDILDWVVPLMPEHKPRYTMGLGHNPKDLLIAVAGGADMFDCVSPTRIARNGMLYTGPDETEKCSYNIMNAQFRDDRSPISSRYLHPKLAKYTRSYLHHLFKTRELLAYRIATMHNLYFLLSLMTDTRKAIQEDRFEALFNEWI